MDSAIEGHFRKPWLFCSLRYESKSSSLCFLIDSYFCCNHVWVKLQAKYFQASAPWYNLSRPSYDLDAPGHLSDEFYRTCLCNAPIVALPLLSVIEYLERYSTRPNVLCFGCLQTGENALELRDRSGKCRDTAGAGQARTGIIEVVSGTLVVFMLQGARFPVGKFVWKEIRGTTWLICWCGCKKGVKSLQ